MSILKKILLLCTLAVAANAYAGDLGWGQVNTIRCEVTEPLITRCAVDTQGGVELHQRHSAAPCIRGRTWDWDEKGVWTSDGCSADFELLGGGGWTQDGVDVGGGYRVDGPYAIVQCKATGWRETWCDIPKNLPRADVLAPFNNRVKLIRTYTKKRCEYAHTLYDHGERFGVEQGCSGEFLVLGEGAHLVSKPAVVRCESLNGQRTTCEVEISGKRIRLLRQLSSAACVHGKTWDYDEQGLWVSGHCDAEFVKTNAPGGWLRGR